MDYKQTTEWLFNQLPMYQTDGVIAYKKDLTNTRLLSNYLDNPEQKIKSIHIAGTNGKGSTSSMIASILQEAGLKVGLYTSPHLKDFRERIKINGIEITEKFVIDFVAENKTFFEANDLSFFEMTVGLAFHYFEKEKVDITVIEVGMGGRLDATNIITPLVSVITNIDKDHTQFLGDTITAIATEKAGIMKPHIPVVIGEYTNDSKKVFLETAAKNESPLYFASDLIETVFSSDLQGEYQKHNLKTALMSIYLLQNEFTITNSHIKNGFLKVITNTGLKGRWQQIQIKPKVIADTAHNSAGFKIVLNQLLKEDYENLHIVIGFVKDKDSNDILKILPKTATYYFCKPNISRGLDSDLLQKAALEYGLIGNTYISVSSAYQKAKENATQKDFIYIGGSTFVVAEVL